MENILEDLLLSDAKHGIVIVRMRTQMNDPIHVQVQVIERRYLTTSKDHIVIYEQLGTCDMEYGEVQPQTNRKKSLT